ncbi:MAG: hypothetical protein KUL88_11520 [Rhizobium sp.]|nr:hypothetical protein [Rhizobium sp.]
MKRWDKGVNRIARRHQVEDRVIFIEQGNLVALLRRTLGAVVVNSTVGLHSRRTRSSSSTIRGPSPRWAKSGRMAAFRSVPTTSTCSKASRWPVAVRMSGSTPRAISFSATRSPRSSPTCCCPSVSTSWWRRA